MNDATNATHAPMQMHNGRWILARETGRGYETRFVRSANCAPSGVFGPNLDVLAAMGGQTYATKSGAVRALRRADWL